MKERDRHLLESVALGCADIGLGKIETIKTLWWWFPEHLGGLGDTLHFVDSLVEAGHIRFDPSAVL